MNITGIFTDADRLINAIKKFRDAGIKDIEVYSPVPVEKVEEALGEKKSPVRFFTLIGALTGASAGFGLAAFTALRMGLITGGKPIVSVPPFLIIAFELTILLGAGLTILGLLLTARLPRFRKAPGYYPEFSEDKYGLVAVDAGERVKIAEEILKDSGAVEVRYE